MHWVGLDLHKHYITACSMDEQGVIVAEHRRLSADDTTLLGWLSAVPGPGTVAMEATLYWAWLHEEGIRQQHSMIARGKALIDVADDGICSEWLSSMLVQTIQPSLIIIQLDL
jgi:hypothetical protein